MITEEEHKTLRIQLLSVLFIILLIITIIIMIFTINLFLKNKDLITSDPLTYGMKIHNFTSCSCFDNQGKDWYSYNGGFIHKEQGMEIPYIKINYSKLMNLS